MNLMNNKRWNISITWKCSSNKGRTFKPQIS